MIQKFFLLSSIPSYASIRTDSPHSGTREYVNYLDDYFQAVPDFNQVRHSTDESFSAISAEIPASQSLPVEKAKVSQPTRNASLIDHEIESIKSRFLQRVGDQASPLPDSKYVYGRILPDEFRDIVVHVDFLLAATKVHQFVGKFYERLIKLEGQKDPVTAEEVLEFCFDFLQSLLDQLQSNYYEKLRSFSLKYSDYRFYYKKGHPIILEVRRLSSRALEVSRESPLYEKADKLYRMSFGVKVEIVNFLRAFDPNRIGGYQGSPFDEESHAYKPYELGGMAVQLSFIGSSKEYFIDMVQRNVKGREGFPTFPTIEELNKITESNSREYLITLDLWKPYVRFLATEDEKRRFEEFRIFVSKTVPNTNKSEIDEDSLIALQKLIERFEFPAAEQLRAELLKMSAAEFPSKIIKCLKWVKALVTDIRRGFYEAMNEFELFNTEIFKKNRRLRNDISAIQDILGRFIYGRNAVWPFPDSEDRELVLALYHLHEQAEMTLFQIDEIAQISSSGTQSVMELLGNAYLSFYTVQPREVKISDFYKVLVFNSRLQGIEASKKFLTEFNARLSDFPDITWSKGHVLVPEFNRIPDSIIAKATDDVMFK
jgi:hypothetical protein